MPYSLWRSEPSPRTKFKAECRWDGDLAIVSSIGDGGNRITSNICLLILYSAASQLALLQSGQMFSAGGAEIPGFSAEFETIVDAIGGFISRIFEDMQPEVMRFSALTFHKILKKAAILKGFRNLLG
jgi:hypothetical protein